MEFILCPTDFSARADTAVFYADELARRMNDFLLYFHIIYKPSAPQMVSKDDGPKTSWRVDLTHIAAGLSRFCHHHPAGILVMGYHPHHFWQHLFTQNYTRQLAEHLNRTWLVIQDKP